MYACYLCTGLELIGGVEGDASVLLSKLPLRFSPGFHEMALPQAYPDLQLQVEPPSALIESALLLCSKGMGIFLMVSWLMG